MERAIVDGVLLLGAIIAMIVGITQLLDRYIRHLREESRRRETLRRAHRKEQRGDS